MAQVLQLCTNGIQPITLCKKGIPQLSVANNYQSQIGGGIKNPYKIRLI